MNDPETANQEDMPRNEPRRPRANATSAPGSAATVHAIIPSLQDEDGWIRGNAAEALVKIGVSAVPALIHAMQDTNKDVRRGVADVLGKIGDASAVSVLVLALKDKSEKVRRSSALALGQIRSASAVPPLIDALADENSNVRENAASALGRIGDIAAVPALIQALKDRESDVRYTACESLGRLGDSVALPRKILADARLSPRERIELLDELRRARYQKGDNTFRYAFPDTRALCQAVLNEGEVDARKGAQAVLTWLDGGHILVRASQRDDAGSSRELLRAAQGETAESRPETLLRGSEEPDDNLRQQNQSRTLWERLFGIRNGARK